MKWFPLACDCPHGGRGESDEPEDISVCLSFAGKLTAHSYRVKETA